MKIQDKIKKKKSKEKIKIWQDSNKKAIDDYNKRIKENGLFNDKFRKF